MNNKSCLIENERQTKFQELQLRFPDLWALCVFFVHFVVNLYSHLNESSQKVHKEYFINKTALGFLLIKYMSI
jgi:hypothetical protein